jgi:hypothetical protein
MAIRFVKHDFLAKNVNDSRGEVQPNRRIRFAAGFA